MYCTLMHMANTFTQVHQGTGNLIYILVVAGTMLYLLSYKSLKYFYRLRYFTLLILTFAFLNVIFLELFVYSLKCFGSSVDSSIFVYIGRSFPTHRTLMGDRPEAIEGQAKLFRVLTAFARYNPQIGYVQGMSYIAAVLLMILSEEEAFWALVALLEKPKYLSELFDATLTKIQHQALIFHHLLKHRKPLLFQHLETLGVSSVHFIMQWFLTLFTSLPCWDSVLAIWDLIMLHGLQAVFRTGLTIILLLESRIMNMSEEAAVLPVLLRVPVDVSQHRVLIPALWNTDVQEWEINCMNRLVLEEAIGGQDEEKVNKESTKDCTSSLSHGQQDEKPSQEVGRSTSKKAVPGSSTKNVFTRLLKVAQHYLLESGKYSVPAKRSPALVRLPKTRISTSFTQAHGRTRRSSSRRSQNSTLGEVKKEQLPSQDSDAGAAEDRHVPLNERNFIPCPKTASQVQESQLI
uniref:Si:ch211-266k8.4 n=1 Tax=Cyprinus carpio TaxID=7962 RepID=A0A8C2GDX2_CYPCA